MGVFAHDYDELTFTVSNQTQKFRLRCPVQIFFSPVSELVAMGHRDFGPAQPTRRKGGEKKAPTTQAPQRPWR